MKRINGFLLSLFMLISFSSGIVFAQLREIKLPQNSSSSAKFYQNEDKIYTTSISVKFKEKVVDGPKGLRKYTADQIDKKYVSLPNELNKLKKKFGDFELIKMIPDAEWGNNVRKNKRTGETVVLKDMSQWYRINFNSPFPVDSVLKIFRSFPYIEYACEIPIIQSEATTPNDAYFTNPGQWNLNVINATQAWDKTKGSSSIKIGIVDQAHYTTHEDLAGKIVLRRNGTGTHGIQVAGVAGAVTNNSTGIASLGWNTTINAYFYGSTTSNDDIADIITLAAQECDIINMSWKSVTTETIVCSSKTYTLQKPIDFPIIVDAVY
ncbi:MAG TPA: S8 family serine peptidase, partial [Ignavibacteriales bacterium]|nr:S8 family serine peptidase [Ignavibacteriales bacterium]